MKQDKLKCWNPTCNNPSEHRCSRCQVAKYCSRECQIYHWKSGGHKQECLQLQTKKINSSETKSKKKNLDAIGKHHHSMADASAAMMAQMWRQQANGMTDPAKKAKMNEFAKRMEDAVQEEVERKGNGGKVDTSYMHDPEEFKKRLDMADQMMKQFDSLPMGGMGGSAGSSNNKSKGSKKGGSSGSSSGMGGMEDLLGDHKFMERMMDRMGMIDKNGNIKLDENGNPPRPSWATDSYDANTTIMDYMKLFCRDKNEPPESFGKMISDAQDVIKALDIKLKKHVNIAPHQMSSLHQKRDKFEADVLKWKESIPQSQRKAYPPANLAKVEGKWRNQVSTIFNEMKSGNMQSLAMNKMMGRI